MDNSLYTVSTQFQPSRLSLARELRGFTKRDVAARIEKSASAMSRYESGAVRPEPAAIGQLALVLGVLPSFFAGRGNNLPVPLENCHFRRRRAARKADLLRAKSAGDIFGQIVRAIEKRVDFSRVQLPEVARVVNSKEEAESSAASLRQALGMGLGPIPDMVGLLEAKGAIVGVVDEAVGLVDAFSFWHAARPYVFLILDQGSPSRVRFDAAHELGHLVMPTSAEPGSREYEPLADRFAGAFLLPRDSFFGEAPNRFLKEHFYELKARWTVSVAALLKRSFEMGRIPENSYKRGFLFLSQTGHRKEEWYEQDMERPQLVKKAVQVAAVNGLMRDIAAEVSLRDTEVLSRVSQDY